MDELLISHADSEKAYDLSSWDMVEEVQWEAVLVAAAAQPGKAWFQAEPYGEIDPHAASLCGMWWCYLGELRPHPPLHALQF